MIYRGRSIFHNLVNKIFEKYNTYRTAFLRTREQLFKERERIVEIFKIACPKDKDGNLIDYYMGYDDAYREMEL